MGLRTQERLRHPDGRFAEERRADPGDLPLTVDGPTPADIGVAWAAYNRAATAGGEPPSTFDGLRDAVASDLPGLDPERLDSLVNHVAGRVSLHQRCVKLLALPPEQVAAAAYRELPKSLRSRVSPQFWVNDVDADLDPDTGRPVGKAFRRRAEAHAWVAKMAGLCLDDITVAAAQARAESDKVRPIRRQQRFPDPWAGSAADAPPF